MAKEKTRVDYHKLDVKKLSELIKELGDKAKTFNANDYVEEKAAKTELVDDLNADGTAKRYVGKDGRTRIRKKRKAVGTEKENYFNLMKAKRAFYEMYKDEFDWYNLPKVAKKEDNSQEIKDALAAMGVKL